MYSSSITWEEVEWREKEAEGQKQIVGEKKIKKGAGYNSQLEGNKI